MALQYVGSTSGTGTSNGYTVSLSGTLTGGIASSPAAGDIVVVASAFGNTASSAPNITGNNSGAYQTLGAAVHQNDTWDTEFRAFYQVMGSTPDTSLTVTRTTNTAYGGATVVHVWRGQSTTVPIDALGTPASGGNSSRGNPPAVTPTTTGAVVIAMGAGTQGTTGSAFTVPTPMTNAMSVKADGSTSDIGVWIASDTWTSGAYDPPAWTGGTTSTSSSWVAQTIALAPEPDTATGDLAASESGSDAFAATGSISDPAITGTMAATETGSDAFSATGSLVVRGSLAVSETGADTLAASGDVFVRGSLAGTETGTDTASSTGKVIVSGAAAGTEAGTDTLAASGTVQDRVATGTLAATEAGSDTLASTGNVRVAGALASSEAGSDVFASSGTVIVGGALAASETGSDVATSTGKVLVQGTAAATETGLDVLYASGGNIPATGSMASTEAADTASMTGRVLVQALLAASETGADTSSMAGQIIVTGVLSALEEADRLSATNVPEVVRSAPRVALRGPNAAELNLLPRSNRQKPDIARSVTMAGRRGSRIQTVRRG